MANYRTTRIFRTVVLAFFVLLVFLGLVFGIRALVTDRTITTGVTQPALLNTSADRAVRLTVRGPIIADDKFKSYSITISPNVRSLTVYTGYMKSVTKQVNFNNNIPSYEQFVYALDSAGFMNGDDKSNTEERGVCAVGRIYEFETLLKTKTVKKLWTSSCARGNSSASSYTRISNLFTNQIVGGGSIISTIW
jgi:hypothetical protein